MAMGTLSSSRTVCPQVDDHPASQGAARPGVPSRAPVLMTLMSGFISHLQLEGWIIGLGGFHPFHPSAIERV